MNIQRPGQKILTIGNPGLSVTGPRGGGPSGPAVYDTFTDDDDTLLTAHTPDIAPSGSAWATAEGSLRFVIINNVALHDVSVGYSQAMAIINSGISDCTISLAVTASLYSSNLNYMRYPAIVFRYNATTFWRFLFNRNLSVGQIYLGATLMGSTDVVSGLTAPFDLSVVLNGTSITGTVTKDETSYSKTITDSTNLTETYHGIYAYRSIYDAVDDFTVEKI